MRIYFGAPYTNWNRLLESIEYEEIEEEEISGVLPILVERNILIPVEAGKELVIFYGDDRADSSYPRNSERWRMQDGV